jgi:hypothetical protein
LTGLGINSLIIFILITMALKINEINPKELGDFPNYFLVYYNLLVAPGTLGILFVILVFFRNPGMRKVYRESVIDTFLNFKEKLAF